MHALLALALLQALGYLVVKALAGSSLQRFERWGLSFGAGTGILSFGMFVLAWQGVPLRPANLLALAAGLLGIAALGTFLRARRIRRSRVARFEAGPSAQKAVLRGCPLSALEWVSLAIVGACIVVVFADAASQLLLAFDARAIWGFKAKVLYYEEGIYNDAFLDADRLHAKTRYPQLIPLAEAFVASITGGFHEPALKLLFPCFYVALILLVGSELRRVFDRRCALVATSLFASLPAFTINDNGGAASGYADLPLAFYVTALAVNLFRWLETKSWDRLRLAFLFTSLAAFTKAEGLALVAIVFLAAAASAWLLQGWPVHSLWPLAATALAGLVSLAPWFSYRSNLPIVDEDFPKLLALGNLANGVGRLPHILRSFGREFFLKPHLWSLLGISAAALLVWSPRRVVRSRFAVFLWISALYSVTLTAIFMVIPWQLEALFPVALTRLMMHVAPSLFLWICFELGDTMTSNQQVPPGISQQG